MSAANRQCLGCSSTSVDADGLCRTCAGRATLASLNAGYQSTWRARRRGEDMAVNDHRLLNADRSNPRKAHCSCGSWSRLALVSPSARRAWHRRHLARLNP